jgi:hypothetical protein
MKKLILTSTFLVAGAICVFAQGKIGFDNQVYNFSDSIENGGPIDYKVYYAGGMNPGNEIVDPAWSAQLWEGDTAVGAKIPFYSVADGAPGVWNTGVDPDSGIRTLSVPGGTAANNLTVKIYDPAGNLAGTSGVFSFTPSTSSTPPPDAFLMSNFRGFSVPEPSTVALGVLGVGALLLFRRRK